MGLPRRFGEGEEYALAPLLDAADYGSSQPMDLLLLLKGILIGLMVSAPVGPVAVLCLRRTLQTGAACGYASAAGAVTADMIFGVIACFGVAAVAAVLTEYSTPLRIIGGLLLLGMGISSWRSRSGDGAEMGQAALLKSFGSSFALTITNPMTIFAFTGLLAASDIVSHDLWDLARRFALVGRAGRHWHCAAALAGAARFPLAASFVGGVAAAVWRGNAAVGFGGLVGEPPAVFPHSNRQSAW
jgi:threonine/homoserine/homoserine lactone efflux protein